MATAATGLPTPAAAAGPPVKEDSLAVLKALAEASAVFVALTFIGGWSYLAAYYRTFGLNPLELDISVPVVSTIAVYVLYQSVWPLIVAGVLIVGFAIFAQRLRRFGRGAVVGVVAVLLLTAATAGAFHGRQVANQDTLADSATLPLVAFASKVKDPEPSCVEYETYGSLDCKLLLHLNGTYYFFEPVPQEGIGSMNLYQLSDSDVLGVHVQRGLDQAARIE
jgi:hypothetical protein